MSFPRLKDLDLLKIQMKSVQDSNEHMLGDISKMQGQITKAEAAYNDTAILIDSVKKVSDENSKKLDDKVPCQFSLTCFRTPIFKVSFCMSSL